MKCNVNGTEKEIIYTTWDGSNYSPDAAYDLLNDGGNAHDDDHRTIYTPDEYAAAADYLRDCAAQTNTAYREQNDGKEDFVFAD